MDAIKVAAILVMLHVSSEVSSKPWLDPNIPDQPHEHFQSVLGLRLNFCPTPSYTTGPNELIKVTDRFHSDLCYTQMTFTHKDNDYDLKQLFLQSDWEPNPANISIEF
jgi:hypothetical protein